CTCPADAPSIPAILRVESLGQGMDLRHFVEAKKEARSACRRIAKDGVIGIHTVDQNVCPTRTHTINRDLPRLAARKQRRSTAGSWGDSGLQDSGIEQIAAVDGKVGQACYWKEFTDSRGGAVDRRKVRADRHLLFQVAYSQ